MKHDIGPELRKRPVCGKWLRLLDKIAGNERGNFRKRPKQQGGEKRFPVKDTSGRYGRRANLKEKGNRFRGEKAASESKKENC